MGMLLDTLQKKLNRRALTTDELVRFVESVDRKLWDAIFTLGQPPLSEQQRKDERDQWILTRWNEGGTWKRIVKKLKEIAAERNWRALADIPTVRRAAITYAKKTSQNMRKGQGGRPKSAD
jgi:hypothetical protein